jgi:hypothetical protein
MTGEELCQNLINCYHGLRDELRALSDATHGAGIEPTEAQYDRFAELAREMETMQSVIQWTAAKFNIQIAAKSVGTALVPGDTVPSKH